MANRYWAAGVTGNWNSTASWSSTSNGLTTPASVPISTDDVFFNGASGTVTATLDISPTVQTLTCNNYTGTLAFGTNTITLSGIGVIFTGDTTMTITGTPLIICTDSSNSSRTITATAVTEANSISFRITGGTGTLSLLGSYRDWDFTDGTNPTGFGGTMAFASLSIYGSLKFSTNMADISASTNTLTFAATSGVKTINTAGVMVDRPFTFNGVGGSWQLQSALTLGNTITTTLTRGTLDLNNYTLTTGIFSSSNANTRSIAFGISGKIMANYLAGTETVVDFGSSTGFTYTGTSRIEVTGAPTTGTRTILGPTSVTGTEGTALNIYVTNGSDTVTVGTNNRYYRTLDFTGFTGTINSGSDFTLFGDLVIPSNVTYGATPASGLIFASTNATPRTITTPGRTFNCPLNFDGVGGTWAFQNALTMTSTNALSLTNGTLKLQSGATSVVGSFLTPGTNQVYLRATTPGTQATISAANYSNIATNISIQDSNATGGAFWEASNTLGTVNAGNNSGWFLGWEVIPNNQSPSWTNITQA
jgi:hypothetical protein